MGRSTRAALRIAAKDLRQRVRDRSAIVVALIAPFGLAAIFGLLLGGSTESLDLRYAYVDLDGTHISQGLRRGPLAGIERVGLAAISQAESEDAARAAVTAGDAQAALIVPNGFGAAAQSGSAAELQIIAGTDSGLAADILRSLAESYSHELEAVQLSVATALAAGADPTASAELAARAAAAETPILVADVNADLAEATPKTFYAASMAIFFLFFTAQFGVLSLLSERRMGTLPRLVAAPIAPWAIVLGKAIGTFAMGMVAMGVLAVASTLLLGADWGDPVGAGLLIFSAVVAAMGITALVTTLARTEEQAGGWNAIVAITLAILGGAFFDLSQGPEILSQLSFLTPHAWFLEGLDLVAADGYQLPDLALPIAALLLIGVVAGAIGLLNARRLVVAR
jgi:ABC-2 type transport system permease protein